MKTIDLSDLKERLHQQGCTSDDVAEMLFECLEVASEALEIISIQTGCKNAGEAIKEIESKHRSES